VPSPSDADARAFAETRKALLEALDRTQQEAYDQAAELVRRGERRAHEIIVESDQCAALLEEQLTYLTEQIEHVRVRITEIRARLARESQSEKNIILAPPPTQVRRVPTEPPVAPPVTRVPVDQATAARDEDLQWQRAPVSAEVRSAEVRSSIPQPPPQPYLEPSGGDSLQDTLRTLRSALESLSSQPLHPGDSQR
jgi:DNA repair exonuclease SbcCD ATPase subunit